MENFSGQKLGEGVADWLEWLFVIVTADKIRTVNIPRVTS